MLLDTRLTRFRHLIRKAHEIHDRWDYVKHPTIYSWVPALLRLDPDAVTLADATLPYFGSECGECAGRFEVTIQVGQQPDYESSKANLCIGCVRKALAMLEAEEAAK